MRTMRYPDELKIEAVKQLVETGHSVAEVAGPGDSYHAAREIFPISKMFFWTIISK